jgi:predicted nuclease of predicted toxin-antitoxin system
VILDATPDAEVLHLCRADDRVLVSRDVSTMPMHFAEFLSHNESPGIILVPDGTSIGEAIERLLIVWLNWSAEEIRNQIWWLPTGDPTYGR